MLTVGRTQRLRSLSDSLLPMTKRRKRQGMAFKISLKARVEQAHLRHLLTLKIPSWASRPSLSCQPLLYHLQTSLQALWLSQRTLSAPTFLHWSSKASVSKLLQRIRASSKRCHLNLSLSWMCLERSSRLLLVPPAQMTLEMEKQRKEALFLPLHQLLRIRSSSSLPH